jgi:hypothetical protein
LPGVFYDYKNVNYFKIWPTADNNCVISGKNGIIITNTSSNNTIAKFATDDILFIGDRITFQDDGSANTCLFDVYGGLEVICYDSSEQSWLSTIKANRTSRGGTLYGTWNIDNILSGGQIRSISALGLISNKTFFAKDSEKK